MMKRKMLTAALMAVGVFVSLESTSVAQTNDSTPQSDPNITQPGGTMTPQPDGSMTQPGGTMTPDGSMTQPGGTMTPQPDGSMTQPGGTMTPDGSMTQPGGTMNQPGGTMTPQPDGSMTQPGGTMTPQPDGSMTQPGGTMTPQPDGSMTQPGGTMTPQPGGSMTQPGGTMTPKPGGSMTRPTKTNLSALDKQFMIQAAQGGMAEVILGKLAAQRAASSSVKQYGQRMINDHTQANKELMALAARKGVTLPKDVNAKQKALRARLGQIPAPRLDRVYMNEAGVKSHVDQAALFQREAEQGQDPDVKALAAKILPTVQEHLQMARSITNNLTGANPTRSGYSSMK